MLASAFDVGAADAAGAVVEVGAWTGAGGAVVGGLIGAAIPRWHVVYERR